MTPADTFRAAYTTARAVGYRGSRREFAVLVMATSLFTLRLRRAAREWTREHPEPAADRLLGHLGLDGVEP